MITPYTVGFKPHSFNIGHFQRPPREAPGPELRFPTWSKWNPRSAGTEARPALALALARSTYIPLRYIR